MPTLFSGGSLVVRGSIPVQDMPPRQSLARQAANLKGTRGRPPRLYPEGAICDVPGCNQPVHAKWKCNTHYSQLLLAERGPKVSRIACRICGKPARARELCGTHYARWRKGKVLVTDIRYKRKNSDALCLEPGCDKHVHARGLCQTHYAAKYLLASEPRRALRREARREYDQRAKQRNAARTAAEVAAADALAVSVQHSTACPRCGAAAGARCRAPEGRSRAHHAERITAYSTHKPATRAPFQPEPSPPEPPTQPTVAAPPHARSHTTKPAAPITPGRLSNTNGHAFIFAAILQQTACPACNATAGEYCRTPSGRRSPQHHVDRIWEHVNNWQRLSESQRVKR